MILQARQPLKLVPRADFLPEEFRKRIFSHGLPLVWEQTAECPCTRKTTDYGFSISGVAPAPSSLTQHQSDCLACKGRGYVYHSSQEIRAIVTSAKMDVERFSELGGSEYGKGMVSITLLPEHLPAFGDRFTLKASHMVFRETILKSQNATDKPRYPIIQRAHDLAGGSTSFGVRYLLYADLNGVVDPGNLLYEGSDFQINNLGEIEWINPNTTPPVGTRLSLEYYSNPRYVVLDHPHSIRDTRIKVKSPTEFHQNLPVQCTAGLEYLGESDV